MGFFSTGELVKKARQDIDLESLQPQCQKCGAYKDARTKKLGPTGMGEKKILIVGDFPSEQDDFHCTQFHGEIGEFINERARAAGLSINRDCWRVNAIRCIIYDVQIEPGKEAERLRRYMNFCRASLEKTIHELKPDYVLLLGDLAVNAAFGTTFGSAYNIERWRGVFIKDEVFKCTFFATYHPRSFVKYNNKDLGLKALIQRDLNQFFFAARDRKELYKQLPDYTQHISILTDFKHTCHVLDRIIAEKHSIYFDYETTGLKPFRNGHKIACIGTALSEKNAYVIPFQYKYTWNNRELESIRLRWFQILSDPKIHKSAHNIKFEDMWSAVIIGSRIKSVEWCTQMGTHIIDNRSVFSGLKFQTFMQFGIRPYDDHIHPYLESVEGSEFNRVFEAPTKDLMIYCGLDCIYGLKLKHLQQSLFSREDHKGRFHAFKFFKKGLGVMSEMQLNGVKLNEQHYFYCLSDVSKRGQELYKKLTTESKEARAFKNTYSREINIDSSEDLGKLYFEVLQHEGEKTAAGRWKTDKNALARIKSPFTRDLASYKKLTKMGNTYLNNMLTEYVEGRIHPFFDLHIPVTYRSSSSKPNFQNLPKRDPEAMKQIRSGIVPDEDCVIMEIDFSGAEVNVSCAYHRDKNFYKYLTDPTTDMHRDSACDILKLSHDELAHPDFTKEQKKLAKKIRNETKNKWVFAEFYGDWYESCGKSLYEVYYKNTMYLPNGLTTAQHMDNCGIGDLEDFLMHCKDMERVMWEERFPEYTQWKKDIYDFYIKHGYIDTYLGFRFQGYMNRKHCSNYPIQSTSFHLLVYTIIQASKFIRKNKLKTKLVMQIHDSLVASVPIKEINIYAPAINSIITNLHKTFKWMNVPMQAEAEITRPFEDGGNLSSSYVVPAHMLDTGKIVLGEVYGK